MPHDRRIPASAGTGHFFHFPDVIRRLMDDPTNSGKHWLLNGVLYCGDRRESFKVDGPHAPKRCRYCKQSLDSITTLAA